MNSVARTDRPAKIVISPGPGRMSMANPATRSIEPTTILEIRLISANDTTTRALREWD